MGKPKKEGKLQNLLDRVRRWVEEAIEGIGELLDTRSPSPVPVRRRRRPR